jgi:D-arginine utilization repressor
MKRNLGHLKAIADAIAALFHPHVEVVVHDAVSGRIVHISNGFSKRRVGDHSLMSEEAALRDIKAVSAPYQKTNWNGHRMRSITVALRTPSGRPLAYLCINHDRETLLATKDAIEALLASSSEKAAPAALFEIDWREQINEFISDYLRKRSLARSALRSRDLDELIRALAQRGFFEIRTAAPYIARVLGCSRAALYARLKDIRDGHAVPPEPSHARLPSH